MIGTFHVTEYLGGGLAVLLVAVIVRPTPVILGVVAFLFGQVVVRTIRNQRRQ